MKKKKSVTRSIRDEANEVLNKIEHDLTRNSYKSIVRRYIEYCRKEFDVKSLEDCKGYIQVYCDSLDARGLSASTVHTYCAAICKVFNVPMALINKKIRHISEYTKGRTKPLKNYRSSADLNDERWKKIVDFQSRVGIRRSELGRLTGKDFIKKSDGTYNIFIKNGKGGKDSYIYVNKDDAAFIKSYFENKGPDEKIFEEALLKNSLNLHSLRAKNAQRLYKIFEDEMRHDPLYREKLEYLVKRRWYECNKNKHTGKPKPFPASSIKGKYVLRGKNREFAKQNNLPFVYDKLILKAVSVLILSHFRTDITVLYMLYV